jgi:hypothetical protein
MTAGKPAQLGGNMDGYHWRICKHGAPPRGRCLFDPNRHDEFAKENGRPKPPVPGSGGPDYFFFWASRRNLT